MKSSISNYITESTISTLSDEPLNYDIQYYCSDSEREAVFEIELPGCRRADITAEIENKLLIVRAKKKYLAGLEKEHDIPEIGDEYKIEETYADRNLRTYEEFNWKITVPSQVDVSNIKFKCFTDGVLILVAPLKNTTQSHSIKIE